MGDGFGDVVERFLDDVEHLLLDQAGFGADANHDVTLRHNNLPVGFGCRATTTDCL
jgi:hypothetical protein